MSRRALPRLLALTLAAGLAMACGPAAEPTSALPTGTAPVAGPTTVPISITAPVTGSQPTLVITTPVVGPPRTPTPVTAPGTGQPRPEWSEEEVLRTKEALLGQKTSKELLDLYAEYQAHVQRQGSAAGFKPSNNFLPVVNGLILIVATTTQDGKALLKDLETLGLQGGRASRQMAYGYLPIAALASVGQLESLWYINASTAQSEQELQASFALMDRKPSKRLLDLYDEYQAYVQRQGSAAGFRPSHSGLHVGNGLVTIQAAPTKDGSILLKDLEALGLQHGAASRWSVSGLFPIAALGSVDKLESLGYMRESIAFTN